MKSWKVLIGAMMVLGLLGCDSGAQEKAPEAGEKPAAEAAEGGKVTVSAKGQEFKPPIKPEELPDGAWYCDMGTVHWAQMEEGDHTCPLCKMQLKQKPVAGK